MEAAESPLLRSTPGRSSVVVVVVVAVVAAPDDWLEVVVPRFCVSVRLAVVVCPEIVTIEPSAVVAVVTILFLVVTVEASVMEETRLLLVDVVVGPLMPGLVVVVVTPAPGLVVVNVPTTLLVVDPVAVVLAAGCVAVDGNTYVEFRHA